jgi:hypothetical protein
MLALVLLLLAIWVAVAVIGFVFHALVWLAVIAIIAFIITAVLGRSRLSR